MYSIIRFIKVEEVTEWVGNCGRIAALQRLLPAITRKVLGSDPV